MLKGNLANQLLHPLSHTYYLYTLEPNKRYGSFSSGGSIAFHLLLHKGIFRCAISFFVMRLWLVDGYQLNFEHQNGISRDGTLTVRAIAGGRRHYQQAGTADFHTSHALLPTRDYLMLSQGETKRLQLAVRACSRFIEQRAVSRPTFVVHRSLMAGG